MTATPTRPTPEQIQRVLDVLNAGLDLDEAIESVWADVKAPPKPTVMVTEFPDGVVIGWDFCAINNNGCGKPVAKCECKGGPHEAKVFAKWRGDSESMPKYGKPKGYPVDMSTPGTIKAVATTPVAGLAKAPAVHPDGQVVCRAHNDFVDQTEADKNDDGTWTCFACQESGVQVQRD